MPTPQDAAIALAAREAAKETSAPAPEAPTEPVEPLEPVTIVSTRGRGIGNPANGTAILLIPGANEVPGELVEANKATLLALKKSGALLFIDNATGPIPTPRDLAPLSIDEMMRIAQKDGRRRARLALSREYYRRFLSGDSSATQDQSTYFRLTLMASMGGIDPRKATDEQLWPADPNQGQEADRLRIVRDACAAENAYAEKLSRAAAVAEKLAERV